MSPSAGTRPDASHARRPRRAARRVPPLTRRARLVRHLRAPRHVAQGHVHRGPRAGDQRGDRAATASAQGIDGPLFVARDTHALSEPAFHTALEVFCAHGRRRPRRRRRRLHADARALARDPHPQPRRLRRRHRAHARRTTRPRTAATSTTRRAAGRPTPTSPRRSRTRPTSCSTASSTTSARRPRTTPHDYVTRLRRRPART